MIYLFTGSDIPAKDQKISEIKAKIFSSRPDAVTFDYEVLDGQRIEPDDLKKSLLTLPVLSAKRMVVIRFVHKLNAHKQKLILEFAQSKQDKTELVLDTDEAEPANAFYTQLGRQAKSFSFSKGSKQNVFDVTNAISARNPIEALQILARLLDDGNHPLQILGGLVWYWGRMRGRVSKDKFFSGLVVLQEADVNIKRSRLNSEHAVEVAVTKLSSLVAG